jgi:hypothetical protein
VSRLRLAISAKKKNIFASSMQINIKKTGRTVYVSYVEKKRVILHPQRYYPAPGFLRCSCCREDKLIKEFSFKTGNITNNCKKCRHDFYSRRQKQREAIKRERLCDDYVKFTICLNTGLNNTDIPPQLIELKRVQLQITRELRKQKKCQKQTV